MCAPLAGSVVDRLIPWYASLGAVVAALCFQVIQVEAGDVSVAVVVVVIMGLDVFRQTLQVSLATSVFRCARTPRVQIPSQKIHCK